MPGISDPAISADVLEEAAKEVEKLVAADSQYAELSGKLKVTSNSIPTGSGKNDYDYPALTASIPSLETLPFYSQAQRTPLPPDLVEQFDQMQCNCSMGLFPDINRVWMSIDSTIYLWSYIDGGDLAYFDGLTEIILTAGLVLPKPGIFQEHIQFLLVLTTPVDIAILGVSFTGVGPDRYGEMHLQPEPLFIIPSDNVNLLSIAGSHHGRIFAAGKDSCLYEIVYQAEDGWFSQKCRKVNHSTSRLSFLVPSFLSFSEEDPLVQIVIDESRNILYSRSEKGVIQVFDLGHDGLGMSRVALSSTDSYVVNRSCQVVGITDKKLFTPIVHIAPITNTESYTLHLVAITQAGVRLYFTTTPDGQQGRPVLLAMVHARLPPGFSPSSTMLKPGNTIHLAYYRRGTLLLASSQTDTKDLLLSVDPDIFPFQYSLTESQVSFPVDGRSWAIAEVPSLAEPISSPHPLPPAIVTQHTQQQRRFVLLTAQGTYILDKLHPVDQLRTVLERCRGVIGEAVDGFCHLFSYRPEQVCAMCLILATRPDQQIAMWATELFFQFGGEPHFIFPTSAAYQSQVAQASPQIMSPSVYGTPGSSYASPSVLGRAIMGPELVMSGRHQGLCLYLARLMRPFWNVHVVTVSAVPGQKEVQFHSTFSQEQLAMFSEQLNALRSFIERNPQLMASSPNDSFVQSASPNVHQRMLNFMRPEGMSTASPLHIQQSLQAKYRNEAFSRESKSLQQVCQLVIKTCESLALWKLLSESQLQVTTANLKQVDKDQLRNTTFRMFVTNGKQAANALITSLMNHFAGDSVMTDNLVKRLRELAPTVYSENDAVASKANELVMVAKTVQNRYDQVTVLRDSLQLYCKVAHEVDLGSVCNEYQTVQYYDGVVEVCLCAANQKDPQELALHHYKSGHPESDAQGRSALNERINCYNHITSMLQQLLTASQLPVAPTHSPVKPGPPSPQLSNQNQQTPNPKQQLEETLKLSLQSDDELFHVTLYSWMKTHMPEKLVEIQSPFVETFLKQMAANKDDFVDTLNLLWRYYEKNREYYAAAKILERLAEKPGSELSLEQRIESLSRAVMCCKCCNLATTTSNEGEFLHVLEERLEVARLQLQVLHAVAALPRSCDTTNALDLLNAELMDLSKLYGEFAEVFDLYECKLAIVHCAGHEDAALVDSLWQNIINKEAQSSTVDSDYTPRSLKSKLLALGQAHYPSEKYFPLPQIVKLLEQWGCQKNWNVKFVYQTMREISVSFVDLLALYDHLFKARITGFVVQTLQDPVWQTLRRPLHILDVIQCMLSDYTSSPGSVAAYERQPFNAKALSHINTYLMELAAMATSIPGHHEIQSSFRRLQNQLQNF